MWRDAILIWGQKGNSFRSQTDKKKIKNITVLLKTKKILIFLHMYEER